MHFRSPDKELAANVVNTLMTTYTENNFKSRFDSTMQASDWLSKQLVDLQMKVETSQEKLVRYQKEHEILGIDEKQNITTAKLDELNKALTAAESERMDKESVYRLVQSGDPDTIASAASVLDGRLEPNSASGLLEALRTKEADLKIQAAELNTQFGPSYPKARAAKQPTQGNRHARSLRKPRRSRARSVDSTWPPCSARACCTTRSKSRSRRQTNSTRAPSSTAS